MQVQRIGYGIRGLYRVAAWGHLREMTPNDAQYRLKTLRFGDRHGLNAPREVFGVSRRTLYRWKAALPEAGGNPAALAARSGSPRRKRTSTTNPQLIAEIRKAAPASSQPRSRQAPCPPFPLMQGPRHRTALSLHHRPHHHPRPRTRCALHPRASTVWAAPGPSDAHPRALQTEGRAHPTACRLGHRHHRTPPRWTPTPSSRLALALAVPSQSSRHAKTALAAT